MVGNPVTILYVCMKDRKSEYMFVHKCTCMYRIKDSVTIAHFNLPTLEKTVSIYDTE